MKKQIIILTFIFLLVLNLASAFSYCHDWSGGTDGAISCNPADYYTFMNGTSTTLTKGSIRIGAGTINFGADVDGIWCFGASTEDYFPSPNSTIPSGNKGFLLDLFNASSAGTLVIKIAYDDGGSNVAGGEFHPDDASVGYISYYDGTSEKAWDSVNDIWNEGTTGINLTIIATHNDITNTIRFKVYYRESGILLNDTGIMTQRGETIGEDWELYRASAGKTCFGNLRVFSGVDYPAFVPPPDTTPPTINYTTPANNSIVNDIPLNFFINVTDDSAFNQCCFLRNESDLLYTNCSVEQNILTSLTYTTVSGQVSSNTFNITCFDNAVNNNSASLYLDISVDTLNPLLNINFPVNNTIFERSLENITYDIGCSDNNPFILNFTLFDSDDNNVFSVQNSTPAGSILNLTGIVDLTTLNTGDYTGNFSCSDTHTASLINDYSYVKDLSKKMFYFNTGNNIINITLLSKPKEFKLTEMYVNKEDNKYGFSYIGETGTPLSTYRLLLTTAQPIFYIKDSGYNAHFVTGTNWVDFENNDKNAKYSVMKINNYKYQITVITNDLNFMSIGGLNIITSQHEYKIIDYVAINHIDFEIPTFELDSSELITVFNGSVNLSIAEHVIFKGSGILEKITSPQSTSTTGVFLVNNVQLFNGTLVSTDDIISFNFPIQHTDFVVGINNVSLQISEDNIGAIRVSNLIIKGDIDTSSADNQVEHSLNKKIQNLSSTSFINIMNISLNKTFNSATHLDIHDKLTKISGASSTNSLCYAINNITNERTPTYERWLQSNGDSGSTGINYISKINTTGSERWDLFCLMSDTDIIEHNTDMYLLNMVDAEENRINHLQNESTEIQSLTAGTTKIGGYEGFTFQNSSQISMIVTIIAQSTSAQQNGDDSPSFKLNSSEISESTCLSDNHKRGFISNNDIATIKFYMDCNNSIGQKVSFNLYSTVQAGETLNILNVSISGFEVNHLLLTETNIAPITLINYPNDNSKVNRTIRLSFSASDVNDDNLLINITLTNFSDASDITYIASNLNSNIINYTFNFSTVNLGFYNLTLTAFENETPLLLSSSDTIKIENIFPVINVTLINPANNSLERRRNIDFTFSTDVDSNCSLYINSTLNLTIEALAGTNSFPSVILANGTWEWFVNCSNIPLEIEGNSKTFLVHINLITSFLSMRQCPSTTAGMLTLLMIIGISLFFIFIGFAYRIGLIGFFGSLMLMVCSWYITPCQIFFAYTVALFSFVLMIWFVTSGLGFDNKTFK